MVLRAPPVEAHKLRLSGQWAISVWPSSLPAMSRATCPSSQLPNFAPSPATKIARNPVVRCAFGPYCPHSAYQMSLPIAGARL